MKAKIILFSYKNGDIDNFLSKFYNTKFNTKDSFSWSKEFCNPIEISEFIAAFADNINSFNITMWISLDENVFIKISPANVNYVIKYIFERYPY